MADNQTFVIDQPATFQALAFLECSPRMKFGSRDQQETNAAGTPKWDVQLIAGFRDRFDATKSNHQTLKVGIIADRNPAEGLSMYTPVQLVGLMVGVTPVEERINKRTGEKEAVGGKYWFAAEGLRPLHAVPTQTTTTQSSSKARAES
jgi:hypothetical protein